MSQFKEINTNVSDASVNAKRITYSNTIYDSEILKLYIIQDSYLGYEGYNSNDNNKLKIWFKSSEFLFDMTRENLTIYILAMLDNRLKRVRQEAINFVKHFSKILIEEKLTK